MQYSRTKFLQYSYNMEKGRIADCYCTPTVDDSHLHLLYMSCHPSLTCLGHLARDQLVMESYSGTL